MQSPIPIRPASKSSPQQPFAKLRDLYRTRSRSRSIKSIQRVQSDDSAYESDSSPRGSLDRGSFDRGSFDRPSLDFRPSTPEIRVFAPKVPEPEVERTASGVQDADFWWEHTAPLLELMLKEASYDDASREAAMNFYSRHIIHNLGPAPKDNGEPVWKSFMTDDFSPIQYSWVWDDKQPKVRYSVEPIGTSVKCADDPLNQLTTNHLIESLKRDSSEMDWRLFERLSAIFQDKERTAEVRTRSIDSDPGSFFLSFEPAATSTVAKAYLMSPSGLKRNQLAVLEDIISSLDEVGLGSSRHEEFLNFVRPKSYRPTLTYKFAAIDCVNPEKSRVKFYVRSRNTSFNTVRYVLTMGNKSHDMWTNHALDELRDLWRLLLDLPEDFPDEVELPHSLHETAGIMFYFDCYPKHATAPSKVYIPVKHYSTDDQTTFKGLETFLQQRGKGKQTEAFRRVLDGIGQHRPLESDRGIQTYVSCAVVNGELQLTSYLNPEIYKSMQWRAQTQK